MEVVGTGEKFGFLKTSIPEQSQCVPKVLLSIEMLNWGGGRFPHLGDSLCDMSCPKGGMKVVWSAWVLGNIRVARTSRDLL